MARFTGTFGLGGGSHSFLQLGWASRQYLLPNLACKADLIGVLLQISLSYLNL